jgi:hypothetical protein
MVIETNTWFNPKFNSAGEGRAVSCQYARIFSSNGMADVAPCQTTESGFMGRITGVPSRWQASCSNSTVPRPQAQKFREIF